MRYYLGYGIWDMGYGIWHTSPRDRTAILLLRISVVYLKQFFVQAPTPPNLIVETQWPQIK